VDFFLQLATRVGTLLDAKAIVAAY